MTTEGREAAAKAMKELLDAMDEHTAAFPDGDWKGANDRIERARAVVNSLLIKAGLLRRRPVGNQKALELMTQLIKETA